jgi:hypothetical protein
MNRCSLALGNGLGAAPDQMWVAQVLHGLVHGFQVKPRNQLLLICSYDTADHEMGVQLQCLEVTCVSQSGASGGPELTQALMHAKA